MGTFFSSGPLHRRNMFWGKGHFFTERKRHHSLLMVQTTDLIVSCSNVQSDWENIHFCKS